MSASAAKLQANARFLPGRFRDAAGNVMAWTLPSDSVTKRLWSVRQKAARCPCTFGPVRSSADSCLLEVRPGADVRCKAVVKDSVQHGSLRISRRQWRLGAPLAQIPSALGFSFDWGLDRNRGGEGSYHQHEPRDEEMPRTSEILGVLKAACPATWASPLGLAADSAKLESLGRGWEAQMI